MIALNENGKKFSMQSLIERYEMPINMLKNNPIFSIVSLAYVY